MTQQTGLMAEVARARTRVIIDNDFSGDPDGLFQLAHHVLSPSVEIAFVIGSHLPVGDHFDPSDRQAENAAALAEQYCRAAGRSDIQIMAGANRADEAEGQPGDAARAIIREALRDDPRPLFYCAGAGLTDLAAALALEPAIASRLTLIWIGGEDHETLTGNGETYPGMEFNLSIDPRAAQRVFDQPDLTIWQVPRGTYLQAVVSFAELDALRAEGPLVGSLIGRLRGLVERLNPYVPMGETFTLGDQPLVLLTALTSAFGAQTTSTASVTIPRPRLEADGQYGPIVAGAQLTVITRLDTRLLFADMFAKLSVDHGRHPTSPDNPGSHNPSLPREVSP